MSTNVIPIALIDTLEYLDQTKTSDKLILKPMYLRISEFVASERWIPMMNHFYRDSSEQWWFKVLGKGNKVRTIAVSDAMLAALSHYRDTLSLSPLPFRRYGI